MAVTSPSDPLNVVFEDTLYTSARAAANPLTEEVAENIDKGRDELTAAVQVRVKATENVVRKEALRDHAFDELGRNLIVFEKAVDLQYAEKPTEYGEWFELTPKQMIAAPEKSRVQTFSPVITKAKETTGQHPLAAAAKKLGGLWDAYVKSEAALTTAEQDEKKAEKAVNAKVVDLCVIMREVHGKLETIFAKERSRAEGFFRKRKSTGKKKGKKTEGKTDEKPEEKPAEPPKPEA